MPERNPHDSPANGCFPTAAGILSHLGVDLNALGVEHSLGHGFAIFPPDAEPIVLPYVGGERGVGCQHHLLVGALQKMLSSHTPASLCWPAAVSRKWIANAWLPSPPTAGTRWK